MEMCKLGVEDVRHYKPTLIEMLRQSFEKSFPEGKFEPSSFQARVESLIGYVEQSKAVVFGSVVDNRLVGFIWFFEKGTLERSVHINHFVVHENYRGLGIGRQLLKEVEKYAKDRGIHEIELLVTKQNDGAVTFYEKNNFEVERLVMKKRLFT